MLNQGNLPMRYSQIKQFSANIIQVKVAKTWLSLLFLWVFLAPQPAGAQAFNVDDHGVAVHGYDVVAYFQGKPLPGKSDLAYETEGAKFLFTTKANMEAFSAHPQAYLPQYRGYCAYGVRMGKKLDIDPEAYAIEGGKLYLMLNRATQQLWLDDKERNIYIADEFWPDLQ